MWSRVACLLPPCSRKFEFHQQHCEPRFGCQHPRRHEAMSADACKHASMHARMVPSLFGFGRRVLPVPNTASQRHPAVLSQLFTIGWAQRRLERLELAGPSEYITLRAAVRILRKAAPSHTHRCAGPACAPTRCKPGAFLDSGGGWTQI